MQVNVNSASGRLEGIYKKSEQPNAPCVLLLHPHPLYGGNMHNKVVYLMEKAFLANGFSTLRFNFRGVGNSEGAYGDGVEEIIDASTCCDWIQENEPTSTSFWVAGFSFGAYIAIQIMMRRIEVNRFVAIGSPANMFDMSFIYPCPTNGLFVHADKDTVAPIKEAEKIIKKAIRTKDKEIEYKIIKNADHFYNNHQEELYKVLDNYIKEELKKLKVESGNNA
ncbi:MAG: alpha/beta hydrolase [Alphaproteobacteria bacterium]|jgi:alpha/beta superfamily hydrolase|nr:alpha/beta hydrolase [Alphaproteobacteria bacterium]